METKVKAGEMVTNGQLLGVLCNLFGETIQKVEVSYDGQANHIRTAAATYCGDTLLQMIKT